MQETPKLRVIPKSTLKPAQIRINPNDGLALDLYMISYPIKLYLGSKEMDAFTEGTDGNPGLIEMPNECALGTIEMCNKTSIEMESPKAVKLLREDDRILIQIA